MSEIKTAQQVWVAKRISAVREAYSIFECLHEFGQGEMLIDEATSIQIACPFHGADAKPSARFYPLGSGREYEIVRCFKCRENWDSINLYAKFKGIEFMDSLKDLERRFRVRIPKRPDAPEFTDPVDRDSNYVSDKWKDVPVMLQLLEGKLPKLRQLASMSDYVKFCRVLDAVQWDLDKAAGKSNPSMVSILQKLMEMMNSVPSPDLNS